MYHPNKYKEHDDSLNRLIKAFNEVAIKMGNEVQMYFQEQENFRDDGGIVYIETGQKILYDFEKRHNYYDTCKGLKFSTLGQFERKIAKEEIKLSIQSCSDESCLVIAWHEDYKSESKEFINSATENGENEKNAKRFTRDFIEIEYARLDILYLILVDAFKNETFNKKCFNLISSPKGKYINDPIFKVQCHDVIELATHSKSEYKTIAKKELKRRCCE